MWRVSWEGLALKRPPLHRLPKPETAWHIANRRYRFFLHARMPDKAYFLAYFTAQFNAFNIVYLLPFSKAIIVEPSGKSSLTGRRTTGIMMTLKRKTVFPYKHMGSGRETVDDPMDPCCNLGRPCPFG